MKKTLRMLCMGLAAATTMVSFAQEPQNFTSKLWNYDFEKGPHGWEITAESTDANYNCWMPQTKGPGVAAGYHGYNNLALENWKGAGSGLKDNSVSQTVKDLPDGTYVFGAYMTATNDSWLPSIEEIQGVYIFANEDTIPVATHRVEGMEEKWAHSIKFNVATTVEGGILKAGACCKSTTASFVTMDNATLWYFGTMDKEAALYEMAKIDLAASASIADTCRTHKMNVDTLAYLDEAVAAGKAITKAEDAVQLNEDIYWGMRLAKKSIVSYNTLAQALTSAKEILNMQWSEFDETVAALDALTALVAEAEAMYKEATATNADADTMAMRLDEASGLVQLDSCYITLEMYEEICGDLPTSGEAGEYTEGMKEQIENMIQEILEELEAVTKGESSALEAKEFCETRFTQIQSIIDNPIAFAEFPIIIQRDTTVKVYNYNLIEGAVAKTNSSNNNTYASYTSKTYLFDEPLTKIRFTVKETGNNGLCGNYPYFHLGEFELFDEEGYRIELTEEDLYTNACHNTLNNASDGLGLYGLIDGDITTHFHSTFRAQVNEYHYFEVTLPTDREYYGFSFVMTGRTTSSSDINTRQFPAVLDIRYVSDVINDLQELVTESDGMAPTQGTSVGFYNTDVSAYYKAVEEARALINADYADEDDVEDAIKNLTAAVAELKASFVLPDPEKQYRVVSAVAFIDKQNVQKALTSHIDGNGLSRLYWETAHPDSVNQVFAFEPITTEDGNYLYNMKQVNTDLYVGTYVKPDETIDNTAFALTTEAGEVKLVPYGEGRFTIGQGPLAGYHGDVNTMHANGHSSGDGTGNTIIKWNVESSGTSWWYIREMTTLPATVESVSAEQFKSADLHLYSKVNQLVLTADKECAFEDLKIYDKVGEEQTYTCSKNGATATIVLDVAKASLAFSFANAEGVSSVTVEGTLAAKVDMTNLQNAYNEAIAISVVEGDEVGQVKDLSAYKKAIEAAEEILLVGGSDELIEKTTEDLKAAVAGITYNLPVAGQNYFIQSALPWMTRWNSEMDIFVKDNDDYVYWSYVNIKNLNHQWQFIECGEQNGMPAYYLKNVGTELYLSTPRPEPLNNANGGRLFVTEDIDSTGTKGYYAASFNIHFLSDGKVAIADAREGNANGSWCLHPMNHNSGTGYVAHGYMISWGKHDAASAMRIVSAEKVISDFMTGIEDVEIAGEQIAPAVKGIYDLYGRRIQAPVATGIYIIDGKKVLVK